MSTIKFPPGWSSQRLISLSPDEFGRIPDSERAALRQAIRKSPSSPEYTKLWELRDALTAATTRPVTPPSYMPPGWTTEQARVFDMGRVEKLSPEEQRLWAAGRFADTIRESRKTDKQARAPPSYIPAGWSNEQAAAPTFDILSRLSQEDLTRYMQSHNEQSASLFAATSQNSAPALGNADTAPQLPSPLVEMLQRGGYPAWGFVIVRTYYASEERWQAFVERLDELCESQLDQETGEGLQRVKNGLEFKLIEDSRLEGVTHGEARKHFHIARAMGGVAAGLDLNLFLLVDNDVVDSVIGVGSASPYVIAVDVIEPTTAEETSESFPGFFRVALDDLLSELYAKLRMGLSARELWAMLEDGQALWTGDGS